MDPKGIVIADWLLAGRRALAQGAARRLGQDGAAPSAPIDFAEQLDHVAAALAVGRAELFEDHITWCLRSVAEDAAHRAALHRALEALRTELLCAVPTDARVAVAPVLDRGLAIALRHAPESARSFPPPGPLRELAARYLLAVLESRPLDATELVLTELRAGTDGDRLLREVVLPSQHELGRMWQTGEIDVAAEHLGSRVAERLATLLHAQAPRAPRRDRRVLVAAVGGNQHDLAARILADALERAGIDSLLLGADTPPVEIAHAAFHARAGVVALSIALCTQVRIAALTVQALRVLGGTARVKVLVGGGPFDRIDGLWRDIGADAFAPDIDQALRAVDELC